MRPEYYSRLIFGIGIFHIYAHDYIYQAIYSPRVLVGIAWTDGEGCERFWSAIRHLIPSCRCSAKSTRLQVLTHITIDIVERRLFGLSRLLCLRYLDADERIVEAEKNLQKIKGENALFSKEYIGAQAISMRTFLNRPPITPIIDDEEKVFIQVSALIEAKAMLLEMFIAEKPANINWSQIQQEIYRRMDGRLPQDWAPIQLVAKLDQLLRTVSSDLARSAWIDKDGNKTDLYLKWEAKREFTEL